MLLFKKYLIKPRMIKMEWDYSDEIHDCWIVAENSEIEILYCDTGFGLSFPWSYRPKSKEYNSLGTDGEWTHIYLKHLCHQIYATPELSI